LIQDAIVIGAGPAGTTIAALLAGQGRRVAVYDKSEHPRFHIGESLLPGNLPILQRLGVLDAVRDMGVRKPAAEFITQSGIRQVFPFHRALGDTPDHAFQVRRADFDELLARNCQRLGAQLHEGCEVLDARLASRGGEHVVRVRDASGSEHEVRCRYLVDASGRDGLLARRLGWRQRSRVHASAAVFSHFEQVARRAGDDAGNISVYWFEHGWVWMIPLAGDVMSVGAVCRPEYLKQRREPADAFLLRTLRSIPDAAGRMQRARPTAPTHVTGNYSYGSKRMTGPGFALLGDAYAFVDPVFSSGVYLAMNSAEKALPMIEAALDRGRWGEYRQRRRFERAVRRKLRSFTWFIFRFTSPVMHRLFETPRNDWQVEQAVVSMLAGDGDEHPRIRRRLALFRLIYRLHALRHPGAARVGRADRRSRVRARFEEETLMDRDQPR
jgi:flavin-dependent dehydrogenase